MTKEIKKEIKIADLELSKFNPRFTFLDKMDMNIIDFIKNGNDNYSEEEVVLMLLKNEGNLQDMVNLMNSISNSGWIDLGEQIIVIKSNLKYVVAEGNRRLLAIKLLFKMIKLENIEKIIEQNFNQDMHFDDELMREKNFKFNYEKMKNIIKNYDENTDPKLKDKKLEVTLVQKSEELWTLLYTKHISGERPGMRQWKRGKYFVDILNFFPHGINRKNKTLAKKISITLRRDISAIFRDYVQAQFIRDMFQSINNDFEETKEDIRNSNVSALETTYSLKHIRNILKRELNYSNDQFKEMFDIKFDKDSGILSYSGNVDKEKLFKLIIKYYKLGVLKTRPIDDENYDDIAKEVVQIFSGFNIDENIGIDNNDLRKKDIFSFSVNQINNLLITSSKLSNENKLKLESAKEIITNDLKINEKFRNGQKILSNNSENVFIYLNLQLKHNAKGVKKFTHAQAFTLRTIMEQFFLWGIYFSTKHLAILYPKIIQENDRKIEHIKKLSDRKEMILSMTRASEKVLEAIHIKEMLNGICDNVNDDLVRFFLTFYNNDKDMKTKSHILNGFIHAYHRFLGAEEENKMLQEIINTQENILFILENIKWNNVNILDKEIKKYINSETSVHAIN